MATRNDWLEQGLRLLAADGMPGLRVEALTRALGVTKGSFYHHFVDLADYRRALLGHYEESCTRRQIAANAGLQDADPLRRLDHLKEAALAGEGFHRGLEVAVRTWAAQDDDARQTVERVDGLRLGYIEELTRAATGDRAAGTDLARTIYYVLIGSQHAVPPGSVDELRRLWDRLLDQLSAGARR